MTASRSSASVSLAKKSDMALSGQPRSAVPTSRVDGLALVMARNDFYFQNYANILYLVLAQLAAIGLMLAVLVRLFEFTDSREYYFPIQSDNKLIVERGLYEPVYTDDALQDWAQEAVSAALTFGYYDYTMRWQAARNYFTARGWASFTKAMADVKITETIGAGEVRTEPKVIFARVRPGYRPEIRRQGILGGVYVWDVHVPIDVTFYTLERETRYSWNVDIRIVRMGTNESRYGLGISQLNADALK